MRKFREFYCRYKQAGYNTTKTPMKLILTIFSFLILNLVNAQTKFKVEGKETKTWRSIYSLIDESGKTLKVLDSAKYYISMNSNDYGFFAVFGKKNISGWKAIDANENILFQVYNTSFGEPSPDYLIEKKIRIIDSENKIGFANERGQIIIKPQFEIVTSFHNGKAIIGVKCKKVAWNEHDKENDCHHYSISCNNYGFINDKGEILKIGSFTFEEIMKEIDWKEDEDY
jgi:hypothetical protein